MYKDIKNGMLITFKNSFIHPIVKSSSVFGFRPFWSESFIFYILWRKKVWTKFILSSTLIMVTGTMQSKHDSFKIFNRPGVKSRRKRMLREMNDNWFQGQPPVPKGISHAFPPLEFGMFWWRVFPLGVWNC